MSQLVDSTKQKLTIKPIVEIAAKNTKSKYSFNQVFLALMKELTMPDSILMQIGNTIFITHRSEKDPRYALMRALNADTAQNYMTSAEQYAKIIYDHYGIDVIVSQYDDQALNKIFAYVGRNKPANMGFNIVRGKGEGSKYIATAKLGPPRGAFNPEQLPQSKPQQPQGNI